MIICPTCQGSSQVIDSRAYANTIRRRRRCTQCDERWTTYEVTANFMSYSSEIPQILDSIAHLSESLQQAVQDYDLQAFGEVDAVGRGKAPRVSFMYCPKCRSGDIIPHQDDNYKNPRFACESCGYQASTIRFKRKKLDV